MTGHDQANSWIAPARERDTPHGPKPRIPARTDASIAIPGRALITQFRDSFRDLGLGALPRTVRFLLLTARNPKSAAKTPAITALL